MSELDMERLPRMRDYMKAEDLDTEACISLAETVMHELAEDLKDAARRAAHDPSEENLRHLKMIRDVYRSDYFKVMSLGCCNGDEAAQAIIKKALRGNTALLRREGFE